MPFVPNTPESLSTLLSRADSKSPSTTCCGVSNTGKPCRSELTPSKTGRPATGIIAVFNGQRVFFCEKHKDQSQSVVLRHTASFARKRELLGRGSMDTLIEQVELLVAGGKPGDVTTATTVVSKTKRVSPENDPFTAPPKYLAGPPSPPTSYQREKRKQQQQKKKPSFWSKLCCCIPEEPEEDGYPRMRKEEAELRAAAAAVVENSTSTRPRRTARPGKSEAHVGFETAPPTPPLPMMYPDRKVVHSALVNNGSRNTRPRPGTTVAGRGMTPVTPKSYTTMSDFGPLNELYENPLIPPTLSAATALRLRRELSKPFSEKDEPGYIYIFWLTDSPISPQGTPGGTPNGTPNKAMGRGGRTHLRSPSDALQQVVTDAETSQQGQRILLKIGRANNVQRRLHEWSTQCGYNLSLIRFYPHVSASSPGSVGGKLTTPSLNKEVGKKVPNSHRIERLIHLELGDNPENRPLVQCEVCKRTHKEWFSVEASRAGLSSVDEVVKKWIDYGERSAMVTGTGPTVQAPQIPKSSPPRVGSGYAPKSAASRPPPRGPITAAVGGAKKSSSPPTRAGTGSAKNSHSARPSPRGKVSGLASLGGYGTTGMSEIPKKTKKKRAGWRDYDPGDVDY